MRANLQRGVQDSFQSPDENNAATDQYPFVRSSVPSRVQLQKTHMAELEACTWQSPITAGFDVERAHSMPLHSRRCCCGCGNDQQQWCF